MGMSEFLSDHQETETNYYTRNGASLKLFLRGSLSVSDSDLKNARNREDCWLVHFILDCWRGLVLAHLWRRLKIIHDKWMVTADLAVWRVSEQAWYAHCSFGWQC